MPLNIISLNCRGLHKKLKRKIIFNICKKYDVCCLQETYVTDHLSSIWEKEWGGPFFYFPGTNNSKGQIILINNKLNLDSTPKILLTQERIIALELTIDSKIFSIINVYAPNSKKEKPYFFNQLGNFISNLELDCNIFVCGDFNTVLNNNLDIISGEHHAANDISLFNSLINDYELHDIWRKFNPNVKDFTWSKNNPFIARRLDFIFCNNFAYSKALNVDHLVITCSDHKAVTVTIQNSNFVRGPGIWRFNDSLLQDRNYIDIINALIEEFQSDQTINDPILKWDLLKAEIKSLTTQFGTLKNQNLFSEEKRLKHEISRISNLLIQTPNSVNLQKELTILKNKYELYALNKARGAQIRSRTKYIENGEKSTKYFLSMEKSKSTRNTIQEIKTDSSVITNPLKVLSEIESFYSNLYKRNEDVDDSKETIENFIKNADFTKLSPDESALCESNISIQEMGSALLKMNSQSAPGSDGLTVSFYKFFWPKIKNLLFGSFTCAIEKGELSPTQKRGIITVIHKGGDRNNLGNWRPISLLNTDYKLFTKIIALRIQSAMDIVINPMQKGFLKGRNISELIRIIDDSLYIAQKYNKPGMMVSIDFKKAFDSISKSSILNSLQIFNFGPYITNMVSTLITNSESCVRNGGWHSSWFPCERGVRQGCCVSPYLFLLVAEVLSIKLQNSDELEGIHISQVDIKLNKFLQYADDLSLFVKNETELDSALKIIEQFGMISGLKLNRQKSTVLPFGGFQRNHVSSLDVKWLKPDEYIKVLGIYFSGVKEASKINLNWKSKIENMIQIVNRWNKREISLYGRIILCKTFLLSQINYVIQSLSLPEEVLNEIDSIFFKFIWQKRGTKKRVFEKIKRKFLCLDVKNGGLKMISIKDQQKIYNIKWLSKVAKEKGSPIACLANIFLKNLGGINYVIKSALLHPGEIFERAVENWFWKNAASSWSVLHFHIRENSSSAQNILLQPLFLNSFVKYKNSPLIFPHWIQNNVLFVCDIVKNCSLKSRNDLVSMFGNYAMLVFEHNALINAFPAKWILEFSLISNEDVTCAISKKWTMNDDEQKILDMKNCEIRRSILNTCQFTKHNESFWARKIEADIIKHYDIAINSTKESRLRLLHFKILHNIYPTNILLSKMKVKPSNLCEACQVPDYIEHFFYECSLIQHFWQQVNIFIRTKVNVNFNLDKKNILIGLAYNDFPNIKRATLNLINSIILIGKLCTGCFF